MTLEYQIYDFLEDHEIDEDKDYEESESSESSTENKSYPASDWFACFGITESSEILFIGMFMLYKIIF